MDACFAPRSEPGACATGLSVARCADGDCVDQRSDSRFVSGRTSGSGPFPIDGLAPFQVRAYERLRDVIAVRGGAILADSVGLGKTHVAVAIIRDEIRAGGSALVCAPAQLRSHWKRHLRDIPRCRWVSHTTLSRGSRTIAPASLIVVDEAHGFRNPRARRYAALALLCRDARVLLVTATPVNNSLLDFHHLLRLFAARDLFSDIGVPDLYAAVESALRGGSSAELRRIADAVMVRRTRQAIALSESKFPQCGPIEIIRYDLRTSAPASIDLLHRVIPALTFPAHGLDGDAAPRELLRLGLLKRLESSGWAFRASVRRHVRLLDRFVHAAADDLLFDPRRHRGDTLTVDGAVQLTLDAVALAPWPTSLNRVQLIDAAERDRNALASLLSPADVCDADSKLARLLELVDGCSDRILLFTEYRETAHGLWRALADRQGIALVHGSDARLGRGRSSRRIVIERFAPFANHARPPRAVEAVRLLIATDVLAEGLNLQDASIVVSYDLPWNPVRLAQRIGRIDRLGSPHDRIRAIAFTPDRGVDDLLGLMKRIRRKLRHIRIVGGDAPWSLARARTPARVIHDIDAIAVVRERVRLLWTEHAAVDRTASNGAGRKSCERSVPIGVLPWNRNFDAALTCFRAGADALLVLTAAGRSAEVGTAHCWSALADAWSASERCDVVGPDQRPDSREASVDVCDPDILAEARAALRTGERALRGRPDQPTPTVGVDPGAALAGSAVRRWLAGRPGRPDAAEADVADTILRHLASADRVGADIASARIARSHDDPEAVVHALLDAARSRHRPALYAPAAAQRRKPVAVLLLRASRPG